MKLHLPTRLRAAVLACITAVAALASTVGTGALTTGVVAYTIAASQAEAAALVNRTFEYEGVTFSGGALVTLDVANSANVEAGGSSHTLDGVDKMTVSIGSETMLMTAATNLLNSTGKGDSGNAYTLWWDFASTKAYYGQTIRLTGATDAWTTVFNYSPITYGGIITDAASDNGAYTIGRPSATVEFIANDEAGANMSINAATTVAATAVSVKTSGAWALNKSLTLGAATTVDANKTITVTGSGALNISGALTLNAGSCIAAENNAIAVNGALSLDLDGITAEADALISSAAAVSATGLTLSNYMTLAAGDYKLVTTTDAAATELAKLFESTEQFAVTNKSGVLTLTVADVGMVTLDADIVAGNGTTAGNIHDYYASGLNVADHTISVTYSGQGFSTIYTKGLKGSGNITFDRTFSGGNLCVLWVDGDASGYTGTIAFSGPNANAFLKLGSDAVESTDLSAATVDMNKQVMALGSDATIGTLYTTGTEIRAVDGLTSRIGEMTAATAMTTSTTGFAQDDSAARTLTVSTMGELTGTTIRKGVNVEIADGALTALQDCDVQGSLTNKGQLTLLGSITLSNTITMGEGANTTFANDMVLDLSLMTKDEAGVYHITNGVGTTDLGSLTTSNITGIDTAGYSVLFDNNGTITLVDATSDLIWKGGAGAWDETSQNWTKGGNPATFADADRVTFNDVSDVTLVGDLIAGGVSVNAAVILEGSGSLNAKNITIADTGSLTVNGDASVSVDRANINKMQVSGNGTLEINKIGTEALAFDGGAAGFSGTLSLVQDVAPSGHSFTTTLTNFTGTVVIDALINHAASDFGDASKLVFVGSRATDQIGFWCNAGVNPTLEQDIEIAGDEEVRFFMNGTTLNGDIVGNKLRLHDGTANLNGSVTLNRLNLATNNLVLNLRGDATLGTLIHDGNRTVLKVGDAEHQVTLNVTGTEARSFNAKSHEYDIAAGSVMNDNARLKLTNATLTVKGGGVYNLKGICSSAEGGQVGNVVIESGATLHITGTAVNSDGNTGSFMMSNWNASNTYTIRGALISEAGISGRDGTGILNIEDGGLLQLNGGFVSNTDRTNNATINVKSGGTLKVASTTTAYNGQIAVNLENGSTFEGTAANTAIAQNLTIAGSTEAPATANIKADADTSLTLSGVISGDNGALNKTGAGTLVLSGENTYAGGTTVQAGTLDVVGAIGAGDISVGSGAAIILHGQLDATKLTNNGTLEIASGFSGLESAGVIGIEGGAEGNGFNQGGETNIFKTTGTVEGTLSAVFNGAAVAITADGTLTLADDWATYHVNNAMLDTETFSTIKAASAAHSVNLSGIDFAVENQTLKVDADGFATSMMQGAQASTTKLDVADALTVIVDTATLPAMKLAEEGSVTLQLQSSASATLASVEGGSTLNVNSDDSTNTLTFNNGNINRVLNITGATVVAGNGGGTGFNTQATNINAGGVLRLAGQDSLGWGNNAAGLITLIGSAEKAATLELGARQTLKTSIVMSGNSLITAISPDDHTTPMLDPYGGTLTVTGTNNTITTGIRQRSSWDVTVDTDSTLVFDGSVLAREGGGSGGIVKKGDGTLTFRNASGILQKYTADAGVTVLDNSTFEVGANMDLSHGSNAAGSIRLTNSSALNFADAVNLWMNANTSIALDETSSVNFTRGDWSMSITGAAEGTPAVIAGTKDAFYNLNDAVAISDAIVTASATADKTVSTKLTNSAVVNNGSGTLTFSNSENTAYTSVNAHGGNITLSAATSIGSVTIAAGKTLTASAEGPLSITTALTAGAGSTLASALTIGNGAALDLATGDGALSLGSNAVTLGTGLNISEAMMSAITSLQDEASLTLIKGVTSLTGGDKAAADVFAGLTGDYTLTVQDGNLVINAAALPAAELTWEGGSGTWGEGTPWTSDGAASAYVEGAVVTINGEGGTITVQGAQAAKNVTIAHSGYTLNANSGASLAVAGNIIVNENVETSLGFIPTVGGNIVVNKNATLDATSVNISRNDLNTLLDKTMGAGTLAVTGGKEFMMNKNLTVSANLDVTNKLELNANESANATMTVGNGLSVTVHGGELILESSAGVVVNGGKVDAQNGIILGHKDVAAKEGKISMTAGSLTTTDITLRGANTANTLNVTGGTVTITGEQAFKGTGTGAVISLSNATLTNGETDMAFNQSSAIADTTISAKNDKTITVGGTGLKTTLAGGITTEGKVTLDGTLDTTGLTGVSNSGDLTITAGSASLAGLNNTGTVTANNVTLTTATAKGGVLSAGDVTLTGANTFTKLTATGTVTSADTLTVGNGSEMNAVSAGTKLTTKGGVTIKSDTTLAALSNAGNTLTVEGALTLTGATTAGGTVSADALSLTGANTFESIATGALTIADSLKVTGALNATAVSITNVSTTTTALTAGSLTGGNLALTVDEQAIADAMGTSITSLTLANITGLTSATINGTDSFKVGSRDYTLNVTNGVVTITSDISDKIVWDGSNGDVWGDGSSWVGGNQPTAESNVVFDGTGDANVTIAGNAVAGNIFVESAANFTGTGNVSTEGAEISKGTLTIDENVSVAVADTTSVTAAGNIIIKGVLDTDTLAAENKDVLLSGELTVDTEGAVNKIDGINGAYGTLIVGSDAEMMMLTLVADTLTIATDSTVDDLEIKNTGNLDAKGTFTVNNDADVAAGGVMTVAKDLTITGELANAGNITVGSASAPAKLTTGKVVNDGTITVFNDMTATDEVTNNATLTVNGNAELADLTTGTDSETAITGNADIDGALASNGTTNIGGTLDAASVTTESGTLTVGGDTTADTLTTAADAITNLQGGATIAETLTNAGTTTIEGALAAENADVQNDAGTLTVGGDTAAGTLATAAGATTDLQGATIGTSLTNAGTTTIAGALSAANADVQNDAGTLTVNGDTAAGTLATAAGATTNLLGGADIATSLTNVGTTAISGATTVGGDVSNSGNLSTGALAVTGTVTNGGTLNAEGNLTAASLKSTGATAATGNVTLDSLKLGSSGSLTAGGTVKTNAVESTGGSLTADTLDLSGLTAAAKIADVKADKITLGGFDMLTVTHSLSDEAGTGAAKVTLLLDDDDMSVLSIGDEKRIIGGTGAASGMGFTLANLDAVNDQLEAYGLKGALVKNSAGLLVMQMQDNSFETQIGRTENGKVGAAMMDEASAAGLAVPGSALADVYAALDACRDAGNAEAGDKLASALTGSSIAAMGSALSGDVERQLKAIRNRTTTMGVDQCVVNEDMPYFNAWVNAEGDYRKVAADGTLAGYKLMSWGGTVGMDIDCTPSFTCGLAATAMYGSFDGESEDHATGDLNTYYLSAFGRYAKHRWTHTFVATVGMADTSLERTILGHTVKGDSSGVMFGGLYEVGYVFALDREATTCLQPIFNLSFTHASLSGYDEKGANIALSAGDVEFNKLTLGLGARLQSVVGEDIYNRSSILEARALVKVDAGDRQGETSVAFAGSGLPTRTVKSSETGVVGAEFGIGLTVPVGSESGNLFLDASAEIRAEYTNANATVGYRINF